MSLFYNAGNCMHAIIGSEDVEFFARAMRASRRALASARVLDFSAVCI